MIASLSGLLGARWSNLAQESIVVREFELKGRIDKERVQHLPRVNFLYKMLRFNSKSVAATHNLVANSPATQSSQ